MALPLEPVDLDRTGDSRDVLGEFGGRAERITITVDEKRGHGESGKVVDAQALRLARRMKRIAEEHDGGGRQAFGDRHRADPAAHRAPTKASSSGSQPRSPAYRSASSITDAISLGARSGALRPSARYGNSIRRTGRSSWSSRRRGVDDRRHHRRRASAEDQREHSRGQKNTPGLGDVGDPLRRFVVGTAVIRMGFDQALTERSLDGGPLGRTGLEVETKGPQRPPDGSASASACSEPEPRPER